MSVRAAAEAVAGFVLLLAVVFLAGLLVAGGVWVAAFLLPPGLGFLVATVLLVGPLVWVTFRRR